MLSIKLLKMGAESYYLDLAAEDYYLSGGEPPGKWVGGGAAFFNLGKVVRKKPFQDLFRGFYPTEDEGPDAPPLIPLVQNAGAISRQAGWDHTFSAPKSWGVIWSQADPDLREAMEQDLQEAVEKTIAFAERELAFSRTGRGGVDLKRVKLTVATFQHGTSRALDPQPHIHAVHLNVGVDAAEAEKHADGGLDPRDYKGKVTRTLYSKPFYRNKMLLGAYKRAHLAHLSVTKRGFQCERRGTVFEIKGVPQDVMDDKSTRRKEILALLKQRGQAGGKAAAKAAVDSRRTKKEVPPRKQLFEQWQEENARLGFTAQSIDALRHDEPIDTKQYIPLILRTATNNATASQNHFTAHDLLKEALYAAVEFGTSPDDLIPALEDYLDNIEEIVPIPTRFGEQRYTTPKVLDEELRMLHALQPNYERPGAVLSDDVVEAAIQETQERMEADGQRLTREQVAAIKHLTQSPHAVRLVQGLAGVGKTSAMLQPTIDAFIAAGYKVVGAAYTGTASEKLHEATGIDSGTIHMTLVDIKQSWIKPIKHHARQLVRAARGKKTYRYEKLKPIKMDGKTVVIVDEAGMVNCRHYRMFLERAEKAGATLIFVGDYRQLGSIEGTSPFRSLTQRVGCAEITEIKRQRDGWARQAAHYFSQGNVVTAMNMYAERHLLKVGSDLDHALDQLVAEWSHHALERPEVARILTCTNDQADQANRLCQQARLAAGAAAGMHYTKHSRQIIDRDDKKGRTYTSDVYVGDRVIFTKTSYKYGFKNGSTGTVIGFSGAGKIVVKLDNKEKPVVVPTSFEHIRLGYASTTHKAQGDTFDMTFVLLAGTTMDMPTSYVQGTRSCLATHFFTTEDLWHELQALEESPLISQMQREVELSLATDLYTRPGSLATERDKLVEDLLDKWKEADGTSLIVTATEEEAKALNEQCHEIRVAQAQVDWERKRRKDRDSLVAPAVNANGTTLVVGDRVQFNELSLKNKISPNDLGTVVRVSPEDNSYEVQLDRDVGTEKTIRQTAEESLDVELAFALAVKRRRRREREAVENAFLLEPSRFKATTDSSVSPYIRFETPPAQTPTVFDSGTSSLSDSSGTPFVTSRNFTSFETTATHAAADWHQKMQNANQTSNWHEQQSDYLGSTGHESTRVETDTSRS